jgi:hypothetical protein
MLVARIDVGAMRHQKPSHFDVLPEYRRTQRSAAFTTPSIYLLWVLDYQAFPWTPESTIYSEV